MVRAPIWTEDKNIVSDGVTAIEGGDYIQVEDASKVNETVVTRGVVLDTNCLYCGRQVKMVVKWKEVAAFVLGEPVEDTVPGNVGVVAKVACPCGRHGKMTLDWATDIKRWLDQGVHRGAISPEIYKAMNGLVPQ